ncbi:nitroreductase family protein [Haliangium sp.]|uniref:nitroreductase family protein n=1 Tax=Haliangium sp. TaxID=2663208 RepID=UPI003D10D737
MDKPAPTDHPVLDVVTHRYSPISFTGQEVSGEQVQLLLEAARWAASCFNEQPWRFIVATRSQREAFDALLSCLVEGNQAWAKSASVLMLTVARTSFERNGKANAHAWHDVGQAAAHLALQAAAMGLQVHQMAGFSADAARARFAIPDGFEPVAAIAVGVPGPVEALPETMHQRARAPRVRKPLAEVAFGAVWGEAFEPSSD